MEDVFNIHLAKHLFQENRLLFLNLAQDMNRIILILDVQGRLTYLNCHAEKTYCWHASNVLGQSYASLCTFSSIQSSSLIEKLPHIAKGLTFANVEIFLQKEKKQIVVSIDAIFLPSSLEFLIIGKDITYEKSKEYVSNEIGHHVSCLLEHLPIGIFWKDQESRFLGANKSLLEAAGFLDTNDIRGLSDFECPWTKEQALKFRKDEATILKTRQPKFNFVEETTLADHETYAMLVSKVPLFKDTQEIIGTIGMFSKLQDVKNKQSLTLIANSVLEKTIPQNNRRYYLSHPQKDGHFYLSLREKECLDRWILCKTSKEIGRELGLSHRTVEYYISNIKQKLGIQTRASLIDFYLTHNNFWTHKDY